MGPNNTKLSGILAVLYRSSPAMNMRAFICVIGVLPMLFARERVYALIAAVEILVLAAAAAGIAGAAH